MSQPAITVVRLPNPGNARDPVELLQTVISRHDLDLADALHAGSDVRPFACVRRRDTIDVVACQDEIAQALLCGEPAAKKVLRMRLADLLAPGDQGRSLAIAFETPTSFRVKGFDYQLPDPAHLFGSITSRWEALGWPELPELSFVRNISAYPLTGIGLATHPRNGGEPQRGFVGLVRYELSGLESEQRTLIWTLARFATYRGVGRGTTYGMGRVRINPPSRSPWRRGEALTPWDERVPGHHPISALVPA